MRNSTVNIKHRYQIQPATEGFNVIDNHTGTIKCNKPTWDAAVTAMAELFKSEDSTNDTGC